MEKPPETATHGYKSTKQTVLDIPHITSSLNRNPTYLLMSFCKQTQIQQTATRFRKLEERNERCICFSLEKLNGLKNKRCRKEINYGPCLGLESFLRA